MGRLINSMIRHSASLTHLHVVLYVVGKVARSSIRESQGAVSQRAEAATRSRASGMGDKGPYQAIAQQMPNSRRIQVSKPQTVAKKRRELGDPELRLPGNLRAKRRLVGKNPVTFRAG